MGLIGKILGMGQSADYIGGAVERVAEVFVPNQTKSEEHLYKRQRASLDQLSAEFRQNAGGSFDQFVNALNRLPRPVLALGTVGLFIFAMSDPIGFSERMRGLDTVPEPLWWLLGAIVSFYFGARELHYKRIQKTTVPLHQPAPLFTSSRDANSGNAALDEWRDLNE